METVMEPNVAQAPELRAAVSAATPLLTHAIGKAADQVKAEWSSRLDERGRPVVRLTISDWRGAAQAELSQEELLNADKAQWRFYHLWSDLLDKAITQRLTNLRAIDAEGQAN